MKTAVPTQVSEADSSELGGKYLTFKLDRQEFGLEIANVQEIIKLMDITHVPGTPAFLRGIINLRGQVVPVIDLRMKFAMASVDYTSMTCIIVVQVRHQETGTPITTGIIVDEVTEVLSIASDDIESPDLAGGNVATEFLLGIAKSKGRIKLLLDTSRALSAKEFSALEKVM